MPLRPRPPQSVQRIRPGRWRRPQARETAPPATASSHACRRSGGTDGGPTIILTLAAWFLVATLTPNQLAAASSLAWTNVGPGGGGAMYTPTLSPVDPAMGIITCDMGGVYLTKDGGRTWTILPSSQIGRYGHGVAFSPRRPSVIFVGTSSKLYRSADAGVTWTGVTADRKHPMCAVMDVLIAPDGPERMWVAYGKGHEAGAGMPGSNRLLIERSDDGGRTFTDASTGLPDGAGLVRDLAIDTAAPAGRRRVYAATSRGLFVTQDGGGSWTKTGSGLPKDDIRQVVTLCDREAGRSVVLVSLEPAGVFRSEDGRSFERVTGIPADATVEALAGSYANATTAWAAGANLWRTADGGRTWRSAFEGATLEAGWLSTFYPWAQTRCRGVGCDPTDPDRVWATGDMQLWASENGGRSFTELNSHPYPVGSRRGTYAAGADRGRHGLAAGDAPKRFTGGGLEVTFTYQICPDPADAETVYGCYADIGGFRSGDRGASWTYTLGLWNTGIRSAWRNSCYEIAFHPTARGTIWGAFSGRHNLPGTLSGNRYEVGGVAVSRDGGASWTPFENAGLPDAPATSVLVDRRSGRGQPTLYAAVFGTGVYRSADGGATWAPMNGGLPARPSTWRLRQAADDALYLICTHRNPGGIWRYDEAARRWERLDQGFADVRDLVVGYEDDEDPAVLAVAVAGDRQPGVHLSRDGGASWTRVFDRPARSIARSPDGATWFVGGQGLWRSDDGAPWVRIELPFATVNDVTIPPADPGTLWVGTAGGGIFTATIDGSRRPADRPTARETRQPRRPEPETRPSEPTISDATRAKWHRRLVERLQARLARDASMTFRFSLLAGSDASVQAVTLDRLTVASESMAVPIRWDRVADADRLALARLTAIGSQDPADHAVTSWYLFRLGDTFAAKEHLVRAGELQDEINADLGR